MKIEDWIKGLGHEDAAVRNGAMKVIKELNLNSSLKQGATVAAMAAVERWGWDEAFEYPNMLGDLPHVDGSARWALDQVQNAEFGDKNTMPGHLVLWIEKSGFAFTEDEMQTLQDLYVQICKRNGWSVDDLDFSHEYEKASAEECEVKVRELVKKITDLEEYPHKELAEMKKWCRRWSVVGERDTLEKLVGEWIFLQEDWEWSDEEHWFVCAAIELAGLLKLSSYLNHFIELFEMDDDAISDGLLTAVARMMDDEMLADLAGRFTSLPDDAQLYIAGAISEGCYSVDVSPLLPLLEVSTYEFDCPLIQADLAYSVVISGNDEFLPLVEDYIERDFDNLEVGMVIEALYARRVLCGGNIERAEVYYNMLLERQSQAEESPALENFLQRLAEKHGMENEGFNKGLLGQHVSDNTNYWRNSVVQVIAPPKIGRNESCPCGSGKKYKKCCLG